MAEFEIVEADFQQYYNLDVSTLKFQRFARLLTNLPAESRIAQKYSPFRDWTWDKEMQSQILHAIDTMVTIYSNAHRKKGRAPIKMPVQVQPDYVEKAKKEANVKKKENSRADQADLSEIFEKRNNRVMTIEEKLNGA